MYNKLVHIFSKVFRFPKQKLPKIPYFTGFQNGLITQYSWAKIPLKEIIKIL